MYKIKIQKNKNNDGFVILFAVTISSILLAVALGVASIALKEVKFTTSAKDTNNAFLAADTGIEYALFNDKPPTSAYVPPPLSKQTWNIVVAGLGSDGTSCAKVIITKDSTRAPFTTTSVVSKGYSVGDSLCNSTNPERIERELDSNY